MEYLIVLMALFLALSNGANDNFKGFATVWGSNTLSYKQALTLATIATVLGSITSLFLAQSLVVQFSGKGLLPDAIVNTPVFVLSVASGAAFTIMLATRIGFPVSTTHALIGGLVGAGLAYDPSALHFDKLLTQFFLPMLSSPVLAALLGFFAYKLMALRPIKNDCACVIEGVVNPTIDCNNSMSISANTPQLIISNNQNCDKLPQPIWRISIMQQLDKLHILSALAICFARGVNDTPKLMALLLASHLLGAKMSIVMVGGAMALGGVLFAYKVAETMSKRVTQLSHSSGLAANMITASLVLFASNFGLPVSTTHVSVGSIAGVGASSHSLDWSTLRNILLSWLATLPIAGLASGIIALLFV